MVEAVTGTNSIGLRFVADESLASRVIRRYDQGAWSHVDAVADDGRLLGARADHCGPVPSGVEYRPATYMRPVAQRVVRVPATADQVAAFWRFLEAQLGKPYDSLAILAFVMDRDWRGDKAWFCSELQGAALEAAGVFPYRLGTPLNKLTPDGLFLAVSAIADVWGPG